jgi:riboflavin synthase
MFTGVIHNFGTIAAAEKNGDLTIVVQHDLPEKSIRIGDSIACNGCCLTVTAMGEGTFTATLSDETLRCTAPRWVEGSRLHLERAMKLGETLDGHMVSGHVDGLATLKNITQEADSYRLEFEVPEGLSKFIAAKGSVTLDGVSLTVNQASGNVFAVNIIPHTWSVTSFHERNVGDKVNLEIDLIARYVARLLGK